MTSAIHKQQSHGNFRWKNVDEKNSFDLVLNYWQSLMGSLHKGFGKIQANLKILDQYQRNQIDPNKFINEFQQKVFKDMFGGI